MAKAGQRILSTSLWIKVKGIMYNYVWCFQIMIWFLKLRLYNFRSFSHFISIINNFSLYRQKHMYVHRMYLSIKWETEKDNFNKELELLPSLLFIWMACQTLSKEANLFERGNKTLEQKSRKNSRLTCRGWCNCDSYIKISFWFILEVNRQKKL